MDRNKAMNLWTAIVTVFLALCTALGLITTTASAAVEQPETTPKSTTPVTTPTPSPWSRLYARSLPPTMKQRIRAEAHGKAPTCRHRASAEAPALTEDPVPAQAAPPARPLIPLQR